MVQYCRYATQPNVGLKLCPLCISAVMIASFAQVEQADTDVCDVIVQGTMPDCCSAILQILHHASAAHSQSSDLSNVVQPVWQLKQQVTVSVSSTQQHSAPTSSCTCPCDMHSKNFQLFAMGLAATASLCLLHFDCCICRMTSRLCLHSSSTACLQKH